ncbi:MAG: NAD(P)H-binding protein [Nitrospinae bacterium]|nr:NAD(P)H-binding protein [Nitrospinota bacterium]
MILVTGATGFTGGYVAEEMARRGIKARCFVRKGSDVQKLKERGFELFYGDLSSKDDLKRALDGADGIINIVSFKEGHVPALLEAAEEKGISKALFVSTTAIFTTLNAESKGMREESERRITASRLDWIILRPTMIYGSTGDRNICRLIRAVRRFPIHPVLGGGDSLMQPIHVKDLANAILDAYASPKASRAAYNLAGREPLTYRQCVASVADALGKKITLVQLPLWLSLGAVRICRNIPGLPKLSDEQVLRLNEDKAFKYDEATRDFGFAPRGFREGVAEEVAEYFS